jgi:hypothetical protein
MVHAVLQLNGILNKGGGEFNEKKWADRWLEMAGILT